MAIRNSKIKQSSLGVIVLVVVIAAGWLWLGASDEIELAEQPLQSLPQAQKVFNDGNRELLEAEDILARAHKTMNKSQPESGAAETPSVQDPVSAWSKGNPDAVSMPLPNGIVIYEPVSVDMDSPVFPTPGEKVSLALPGGETLSATVKSSNENPNGDYSWRGHLDGYGNDYPVVMTYGGNSVFATVTTPKGSYTLESVNGSGWIYKNPAEVELSDPGKNDYLEIPHNHE